MAQQLERSSIDLRANANRHLRRAGLGMVGGLAVVAAGVFGKVAVKDIDQEWPPIFQTVGEGAPPAAAAAYLLLRRKTGDHIRAAMADRKAAKALDAQPASLQELPSDSIAPVMDVPMPRIEGFDPSMALPDDQTGVSEVVIPRTLIQYLDERK